MIDNERRFFSFDEKEKALHRTRNRCARCGKKLNKYTMTMEHIIPLSRGGTNEEENLIALCEECNKAKNNLLYIPTGFYTQISKTELANVLDNYVAKWFQDTQQDFDLGKFPLIAPACEVHLDPIGGNRKFKKQTQNLWSPVLLYRFLIIGKEMIDEIEAVCDINIKEVRNTLNRLQKTQFKPVALYSFRKVTTDKIMAIFAVLYDENEDKLSVYVPWHCVKGQNIGSIVFSFLKNIVASLIQIAGKDLNEINIYGSDPYVFTHYAKYHLVYEMEIWKKCCATEIDGIYHMRIKNQDDTPDDKETDDEINQK